MGIPPRAAADLVSRLALIPADGILDGAGHHMVYAGHSVSRRGTFKEDELRLSLRQLQTLLESLVFFPPFQHSIACGNQIQSLIFFESHNFYLNLSCLNNLQI